MSSDVIKLAVVTMATLISAPFILASLRAFFFFGKMSQTVDTVQSGIQRTEHKVDTFIETTSQLLAELSSRVTVIESERRVERRTLYGRRSTDLPPATSPETD